MSISSIRTAVSSRKRECRRDRREAIELTVGALVAFGFVPLVVVVTLLLLVALPVILLLPLPVDGVLTGVALGAWLLGNVIGLAFFVEEVL